MVPSLIIVVFSIVLLFDSNLAVHLTVVTAEAINVQIRLKLVSM
jgi:hypothetical protein